MSLESALAFRDRINNDQELQRLLAHEQSTYLSTGEQQLDLLKLAHESGFEFTKEELFEACARIEAGGELSDFELELVSAGGSTPCTLGVDCPEDCGSGG